VGELLIGFAAADGKPTRTQGKVSATGLPSPLSGRGHLPDDTRRRVGEADVASELVIEDEDHDGYHRTAVGLGGCIGGPSCSDT